MSRLPGRIQGARVQVKGHTEDVGAFVRRGAVVHLTVALVPQQCGHVHRLLDRDQGLASLVVVKDLWEHQVALDRVVIGASAVPHVVFDGVGVVAVVGAVHGLGAGDADLLAIHHQVLLAGIVGPEDCSALHHSLHTYSLVICVRPDAVVETHSVASAVPHGQCLLNVARISHHMAQTQHPGEAAEGDIVALEVGFVHRQALVGHAGDGAPDARPSHSGVCVAVGRVEDRDQLVLTNPHVGQPVKVASSKGSASSSATAPDTEHGARQTMPLLGHLAQQAPHLLHAGSLGVFQCFQQLSTWWVLFFVLENIL